MPCTYIMSEHIHLITKRNRFSEAYVLITMEIQMCRRKGFKAKSSSRHNFETSIKATMIALITASGHMPTPVPHQLDMMISRHQLRCLVSLTRWPRKSPDTRYTTVRTHSRFSLTVTYPLIITSISAQKKIKTRSPTITRNLAPAIATSICVVQTLTLYFQILNHLPIFKSIFVSRAQTLTLSFCPTELLLNGIWCVRVKKERQKFDMLLPTVNGRTRGWSLDVWIDWTGTREPLLLLLVNHMPDLWLTAHSHFSLHWTNQND